MTRKATGAGTPSWVKGLLVGFGVVAIIAAMVAFVVGGWIWGTYNSMVQKQISCTTAWSQVETQYQRRFDLIPNLVASTKGYMTQERAIFKDIAEARTRYAGVVKDGASVEEKVAAGNTLEGTLSRLLVIMENYPTLKSNETVQGLMDELAGTENRISVARQRYNDVVQSYNTTIRMFPGNIIAGMFNFIPKEFFQSTLKAENPPAVDLTIK